MSTIAVLTTNHDIIHSVSPGAPELDRSFNTFVTVASYPHPVQAWIAKNRLATEGILAFVHDEHLVSTYWLFSQAIHGVKVQVSPADVERSLAILSERLVDTTSVTLEALSSKRGTVCHKCGSSDVCREKFSRRATFLCWLLVGVPIPILGKGLRCLNCGFVDRQPSWLDRRLPRQFSLRSMFLLIFLLACTFGLMRMGGVDWLTRSASADTSGSGRY
jgi:hypothetical protein